MVVQPKRPRRPEPWRAVLLKERDREVPWLLALQTYRTPLLDRYFSFASTLGEELFFILFLPLSAWVGSTQLSAHLTVLLAMSVGIGNILKNVFLIPRPPHPPVWIHTEASERDHGLPSTHTMTAITLPWYFLIYCSYLTPSYPLHASMYVLGILWTVSVVTSRLYNGHHTPLDVFVGGILGIGFLWVFTIHLRPIVDSFVQANTVTGVITLVGAGVSILAFHPLPPKVLTPAHAETGLVVGTATGATLGLWLKVTKPPLAITSLLFNTVPHFPLLQSYPMLVYVLRFLVGAITVGIIRAVVKKLATSVVLLVAHMMNSKITKATFKWSEAEAAVKYITYSAIGFGALWIAPVIFTSIGLHCSVDDVIIAKV